MCFRWRGRNSGCGVCGTLEFFWTGRLKNKRRGLLLASPLQFLRGGGPQGMPPTPPPPPLHPSMHVPLHFTGIWVLGKLRQPGKILNHFGITYRLWALPGFQELFKRSDSVAPLKSRESSRDTILQRGPKLARFISIRWIVVSVDLKIQRDNCVGQCNKTIAAPCSDR